MPLCASVYVCIVVTCWERANLLALVCGVCKFGILGQVWYLIVSIPDLCTLAYFGIMIAKQRTCFVCIILFSPRLPSYRY